MMIVMMTMMMTDICVCVCLCVCFVVLGFQFTQLVNIVIVVLPISLK